MRFPKNLIPIFLCLPLFTGCAIWPYNDKHVVAVRSENGTNIVERLVQSDTGWASWMLLKPCYVGPAVAKSPSRRSYYIQDKTGRRTKVESLTFLKKRNTNGRPYEETLWPAHYDVRPVIDSDLWLALRQHALFYPRTLNDTNYTQHKTSVDLYVFNSREIVRQRSWTAVPWRQNGTNVQFKFDSANQRITYLTTHGYETYDLVRDAVSPATFR